MRLLVSLAAALALSTVSLAASAYGDGATGYSGKQGQTCTSCHGGNAAKPTVTIDGPSTLAAGATGDFTMTVTTNLGRAAANIAASDGATLVAGTGLQEGGGELSHTGPAATAGGQATFSFKVTAPAAGGVLKLFAAGMGSNGAGTGGDGTTLVTKDVTVTAGTTPPPAGGGEPATPPQDDADSANAGTKAQSSTPGSSTSQPAKKKKTAEADEEEEEEEEEEGAPRRRRVDPYAGRGGCSASRGPLDASGALALTLALAAAGGLARRRARRR